MKKLDILKISIAFLLGFLTATYLKSKQDSKIIKNLKQQIDWLESGAEWDEMLLEVYHNKLFNQTDSLKTENSN